MSHPDLDEAAVVGIPDPILGEIVVACLVTTVGSSANEETVQQFLRGSLASYKIPRRVLFFGEGELPRTASQKHNVDEIRSLAIEKIGAEQAGLAEQGASNAP